MIEELHKNAPPLIENPVLQHQKFICDAHLGRLAKHLRMLGFDTIYQNTYIGGVLSAISDSGFRTLLTGIKSTYYIKTRPDDI